MVIGWLLLLAACGLALTSRDKKANGRVDWSWWALIGALLLAFRWPVIALRHELYPDESQLMAGALTLRHDLLYWRTLDGHTAGPLDIFPLLPVAWFPGEVAYVVARLIATGLIWGTIASIGEAVAEFAGRRVARLAVLPFALFAAFTTSAEFVHHSTELTPCLMLAVAAWLAARQSVEPTRRRLWFAAILLGAVPFAKLQAAPIAGVLGLLLAIQELIDRRPHNLAPLLIGALLPTSFAFGSAFLTGQVEHLVIPYFLQNTFYLQGGRMSVGTVVSEHWRQSVINGYLALWFVGSAVFLACAWFLARRGGASRWRALIGAAVLFSSALACVLAPGRPYHHYLNLAFAPLTLLLGLVLGATQSAAGEAPAGPWRWLPVATFALCGVVPLMGWRIAHRTDPFAYYNTVQTSPSPDHRALAAAVRSWTAPGESLGMWGWRSSLYVETGLRQATHEAHTQAQTLANRWQSYHLRRYQTDFEASHPPVFVDAAGPGNFWFSQRSSGHELFPWLRDWIARRYTLAADLDGARLYVRNDRFVRGNTMAR